MAKKPRSETVEIYGLLHPVTRDLRYIGKANDAAERLKSHIRDARHRAPFGAQDPESLPWR